MITGGTGYIGNYVTKILAATNPHVKITSMARSPVDQMKKRDDQTSRFKNVRFHQGDCLKPETYPTDLGKYDAVIHTVGTLIDGLDYKKYIRGGIDPQKMFRNLTPWSVLQTV